MDTIMFERSRIDELTTLEKALEVYHKDKFLAIKQELLGPEFDEEAQTKIWADYHELMYKAVMGKFEKGDIERLEKYRRLEGHFEDLSNLTGGEKLYFPTDLIRDNAGQIVRVTFNFFDNEITKRWFDHIYDILVGQVDVRVCAEEDCSNFFVRKRRKDKKFCSDTCRQRDWQRKHRKRKL
ncbi:MAG: CGNR zinc finger domain-containing protein [Deltaproteobacteria bacterium]|nr:CGNR zinc finger domain-containing protein [Deltaproteobacteria bacterium]